MSWVNHPDRELVNRLHSEGVITDKELEVLVLQAEGYGRRLGAIALRIGENTWRDRRNRARLKIRRAKEAA